MNKLTETGASPEWIWVLNPESRRGETSWDGKVPRFPVLHSVWWTGWRGEECESAMEHGGSHTDGERPRGCLMSSFDMYGG